VTRLVFAVNSKGFEDYGVHVLCAAVCLWVITAGEDLFDFEGLT